MVAEEVDVAVVEVASVVVVEASVVVVGVEEASVVDVEAVEASAGVEVVAEASETEGALNLADVADAVDVEVVAADVVDLALEEDHASSCSLSVTKAYTS